MVLPLFACAPSSNISTAPLFKYRVLPTIYCAIDAHNQSDKILDRRRMVGVQNDDVAHEERTQEQPTPTGPCASTLAALGKPFLIGASLPRPVISTSPRAFTHA